MEVEKKWRREERRRKEQRQRTETRQVSFAVGFPPRLSTHATPTAECVRLCICISIVFPDLPSLSSSPYTLRLQTVSNNFMLILWTKQEAFEEAADNVAIHFALYRIPCTP